MPALWRRALERLRMSLIATALGIPAVVDVALTQVGKTALAAYRRDKIEEGQEILLKEIAKGKVWAIADDKAAAMLFRYMRAMQEGEARRNLELMAEALASAASDPAFEPDEFKRHADKLADLSRQEIYILAAFISARDELGFGPDFAPPVHYQGGLQGDASQKLVAAAYYRAMQSGLFSGKEEYEGVCAALSRTGWIKGHSGWGSLVYSASPLLSAVARLVDFPAATGSA